MQHKLTIFIDLRFSHDADGRHLNFVFLRNRRHLVRNFNKSDNRIVFRALSAVLVILSCLAERQNLDSPVARRRNRFIKRA